MPASGMLRNGYHGSCAADDQWQDQYRTGNSVSSAGSVSGGRNDYGDENGRPEKKLYYIAYITNYEQKDGYVVFCDKEVEE